MSETTTERRKGYQPTDEEVEERIEFCRQVMRRTRHKSKIRKAFREEYGQEIDWHTIDNYCSRARDRAKLEYERTRAEMRIDLAEIIAGVMEDATSRRSDVIAAAREFAKLWGLNLELPPVEVICDQLGISVDTFYTVLGQFTRAALPRPSSVQTQVTAVPELPG